MHTSPAIDVELLPGFWHERVSTNRTRAIPALLERLGAHGVIDNFRRRSGRCSVDRRGFWFTDSDLYKWIEAAAWAAAAMTLWFNRLEAPAGTTAD